MFYLDIEMWHGNGDFAVPCLYFETVIKKGKLSWKYSLHGSVEMTPIHNIQLNSNNYDALKKSVQQISIFSCC